MSSANRLPLHILPLNKQHTGLGAKGTPHGWPFTLWLTSENPAVVFPVGGGEGEGKRDAEKRTRIELLLPRGPPFCGLWGDGLVWG